MAKVTKKQYKDAAEGFMYMLSMFQQGFKKIQIENAELSTSEQIALTEAWWLGEMSFMGQCAKKDDSKGLF
jgi:hypothetical protein